MLLEGIWDCILRSVRCEEDENNGGKRKDGRSNREEKALLLSGLIQRQKRGEQGIFLPKLGGLKGEKGYKISLRG